ncbi:WW domain-containing oxidoreductase-like [Crocuta crocuta]
MVTQKSRCCEVAGKPPGKALGAGRVVVGFFSFFLSFFFFNRSLEWICSLPRSWTYGITRGGRVFFINEEAKSTTWLHPVTGEAVVTGHRRQSTDLPTGWEEAYTFEGARYYIK